MFTQLFRGIDRAVLTASTAEAYHQVGEIPAQIIFDGWVDYIENIIKEILHFFLLVEKISNRFIFPCKVPELGISSRVINEPAVKNEAAAVFCGILGNSFIQVAERIDSYF